MQTAVQRERERERERHRRLEEKERQRDVALPGATQTMDSLAEGGIENERRGEQCIVAAAAAATLAVTMF